MMTILFLALYVYAGVALLFAAIFIGGVIVLGGFQEFADRSNVLLPEGMQLTAVSVQWWMLFSVLFWPIIVLSFSTTMKRTSK
jgi:hypothetical protein